MIKYILILCLSILGTVGISQTVEGIWQTYDHNSGELESDVSIYISKTESFTVKQLSFTMLKKVKVLQSVHTVKET